MKSPNSTLAFLSQYTPASETDALLIDAFLEKRLRVSPKLRKFGADGVLYPLDIPTFTQWFENGLEPLKIAQRGKSVVMVGYTLPDGVQIIAKQEEPHKSVEHTFELVKAEELTPASPEQENSFQAALLNQDLQPPHLDPYKPFPAKLELQPKERPIPYTPTLFHDFTHSVEGIGIVREIAEDGDIELCCYMTFPSVTCEQRIGVSMHETGIINMGGFLFETVSESTSRSSLGNSISCLRKFQRELENIGLRWYGKLHRLEPIDLRVEKGKQYWFVDDKLNVRCEIDRDTSKAIHRYQAGNYFRSRIEALKVAGKFRDLIKDNLVSAK